MEMESDGTAQVIMKFQEDLFAKDAVVTEVKNKLKQATSELTTLQEEAKQKDEKLRKFEGKLKK